MQNSLKMLLDLPPEFSSPAARVNNDIFFVGELLRQTNGSFFVPEQFFYIDDDVHLPSSPETLCALGHEVIHMEVGIQLSWIFPGVPLRESKREIEIDESEPRASRPSTTVKC